MSPAVRQAVLQLYRDVDRAVADAGPVCLASGRCCRFQEFGHVLYLSSLEADILLADASSFQKPVSPAGCPFQNGNLCTARDPRPLGCRIFFCDPHYQEKASQIMEEALHRLKALSQQHGVEWEYAPLHYFLNEHKTV